MKPHTLLAALSAANAALAAVVNVDKPILEADILNSLLRYENLLPQNSRRMLLEKTKVVTQVLSKGTTSQIDPDVGKYIASLPGGLAMLESLQVLGPIVTSKPPNPTVPQFQDFKGTIWKEATQRKVRHGPYRIPPVSEKNVASEILKIQGVSNTFSMNVTKPCKGQCTILQLTADLEYADGTAANNKNGAWLHHITLLNAGPTIVDPLCGGKYVESLFMSGNERSLGAFALQGAKIKSGYSLTDKDSFILTTELMNMEDTEKYVWVTLTYELLDGPQPDYRQAKNVFMSIGPTACSPNTTNPFGPSNMTTYQQPKSMILVEHSIPWRSPGDGYVLSTSGHTHDGANTTEIYLNDKKVCESVPVYGRAKAMDTHSHEGRRKRRQVLVGGSTEDNVNIDHILKQSSCDFPDGIPIKKGDTMYQKVVYDFHQHPGMKNKNGELDEIMGIVGTLIALT